MLLKAVQRAEGNITLQGRVNPNFMFHREGQSVMILIYQTLYLIVIDSYSLICLGPKSKIIYIVI